MSDTTEIMLDGTLCECCGVYLGNEEPAGYPMYCSLECAKDRGKGKEVVYNG